MLIEANSSLGGPADNLTGFRGPVGVDETVENEQRGLDPWFEDRLFQAVAQADRTGERIAVHTLGVKSPRDRNSSLPIPPIELFLVETASRIDTIVRECDAATYLGRAKFAILQRAVLSTRGVETLANKLIEVATRPIENADRQISLAISNGLAYHTPGIAPRKLLSKAEENLAEVRRRDRP